MVSAGALTIFSGKIFLILRLSRSAERSKRIFHGKGRKDKIQSFPQRRAFVESGAATAVFLHDSTRENGIPERPQTLRYSKIINIFSLIYAQSNAERILNRPTQ
mgnify:CR=1 FL=1